MIENISSDHIVEGENTDAKDSELILSLLNWMHDNDILEKKPSNAEIKFINTVSGKTKRIISVDF